MYWMQAALLHLGLYGGIGNRTTIPNLSGARLKQLKLPLPPLREQQTIVQTLSKIQTAVETQERIVAALKELKAATLAKLFREGLRGEPLKQTEIGEIPESWGVVRLGSIAKIGNGSTPKRDNLTYWENGTIPWLTSAKVHESIVESADEHVSAVALAECHLPLVRKNSIVVAITGEGKTRGNAALVTFDTCVSQHLAYIQLETEEVIPEFVLSFLQGRYEHLRQVSASGGSTRAALTCEFLRGYAIPRPSRREQIEIATALGSLSGRVRIEESRREGLAGLFSSVLRLLMGGQLRVRASTLGGRVAKASQVAASDPKCTLSEETLQEIVRRLVVAVQPERIILFGSAARGEMGPDSDVDLLVVKSGVHRRELAARLYRELADLPVPKDIIVATPEDLERHRDTIGLVYRAALREGRVVYDAV